MKLFDEEDIQVERIWCGEESGTKLLVKHNQTDLVAERMIGFEDEGQHRHELIAELAHRFSKQFPPEHFIIEHLWLGPGEGAALQLRHAPTGISVGRNVGCEPQGRYQRELFAELLRKLQAHERSQG
jgi:hypothetical protein